MAHGPIFCGDSPVREQRGQSVAWLSITAPYTSLYPSPGSDYSRHFSSRFEFWEFSAATGTPSWSESWLDATQPTRSRESTGESQIATSSCLVPPTTPPPLPVRATLRARFIDFRLDADANACSCQTFACWSDRSFTRPLLVGQIDPFSFMGGCTALPCCACDVAAWKVPTAAALIAARRVVRAPPATHQSWRIH
jgi:hypothetical protein